MAGLKKLMEGLIDTNQIPSLDITQIAYDSRQAVKGSLFVALVGVEHDGHDYIPNAIQQGAAVILGQQEKSERAVPYLHVPNTRTALATIAARFYGEPTRQVPLIGVTGTNGKTTCCYLLEAILKAAGKNPAVFGTINYRFGGKTFPAPHTTPEAPELQRWAAEAVSAGADVIVMEVSSHGLMMERVRDCHFDTVLFTNLSQDHLDFHGTMEEYYTSKRKLFTEILLASDKPKKQAILNDGDSYGKRLAEEVTAPVMRCALTHPADYSVTESKFTFEGTQATVVTPHGTLNILSPLLGSFNLQNILLTIAAAQSLKLSDEAICEGINAMAGAPGRLERVTREDDRTVFVDYAHTPEALRAVLTALRTYTRRRLITLFGCGGDRDREKRPLMGNVAAKLSDVVIVTSDNPRTEDPEAIITQILPGIQAEKFPTYQKSKKKGYWVELDRRKAICQAISLTEKGDIVLIAGKGHEDYQILGKEKIHFDDREEAKAACRA